MSSDNNPDVGYSRPSEYLGRSGRSWVKLGVISFILFLCLAGFIAAMIVVFYPTDDGTILMNSILGFGEEPRPENVGSKLTWHRNGDRNDMENWLDYINDFIKIYEGSDYGQDAHNCKFEDYEVQKENKKKGIPLDPRVCVFKDTWLAGYCHKAEHWGIYRDSPCILLKLEKMIDWEPEVYEDLSELPDDMPLELKLKIENKTEVNNGKVPPIVWVSCDGETETDKKNMPRIMMSPFSGFPAYYFPDTGYPGYQSPLVGVQFSDPEPNVLINVICRVWAKNILDDKGSRFSLYSSDN